MEEKESLCEYQGNRFALEKQGGWYSRRISYVVKNITVMNTRLQLPDFCGEIPVESWHMHGGGTFPMVKELFIPSSVTDISIDNGFFPALEKVEVEAGHSQFSTDGKMLFSADGRELLYSFAAGNQEKAVVPREVRKILRHAFAGAVCSEIIFENPDISAERDAFENSNWMKLQGDYSIVGNMFFRMNRPADSLTVPDGIRRFHESAFWRAVPGRIDTPVMPSRSNMEDLGGRRGYRQCRELNLRSPGAKIDLRLLRSWQGLQAVHIAEGHVKYCSADGVVFSKDGKVLEFYPQNKAEIRYYIPDGVVKIGRMAFQEQNYLEEVAMPDSVTTVGMGAFFRCGALKKVHFSGNIRVIPDASVYQNGGVFEECGRLCEVTLPQKLQYLGSYAFCRSGLKKVSLNGKLRQMGEYALAAEGLRTVSLPSSLERMGKGALLYAEKLDACQGTAKGLVAAVNAVPPGLADKSGNVEWTRCMVRAYRKRGDRTEDFLIPGSVKRNAAYHLDMAWNGEEIDYTEYDACFDQVLDPEERLELAVMGILRTKGQEDSAYVTYMRHSAMKIASNLVETGKEEAFLAFLQEGYLSDAALEKLLKITNQKNMTICSAYILKYRKGNGARGQRRFAL